MANPNNPHNLCTWRSETECGDCLARGDLNCRFNWGDLAYFAFMFLPLAIAAIAGMIRGGYGWWVVGWFGYMAFFFNVWETRILCSHCPYYAESGHTLHCIANYGMLKIWKYRPGPMSRSEQVQFIVGALLLLGFPFPFLLLGAEYVLTLIALVGSVAFVIGVRKQVCPRCVNFSCSLNNVPKEMVGIYLDRNPVMRRAWEKSGYQLEGRSRT